MKFNNLALLTDSYKFTHWKQYPKGTENIYSYFESRKGAEFPYTIFFGLQKIIKENFLEPITKSDVEQAKVFVDQHIGEGIFHYEGWMKIVDKHDGFLPIRIMAVPEGTKVPTGNVMMTVENTDPDIPWITNYVETILTHVWYPSTVATLSSEVKEIILRGLEISGNPELIDFKLHDFGFRGATCVDAAGIGGLAHLINFQGTDTVHAITTGMRYYNSGMCGFTIPASEHSTVTIYGKDNEPAAHRNMMKQFPTGMVSSVSDSYDFFEMLKVYGTEMKEEILSRDGVFIVRPDSGEIVSTLLKTLETLGTYFNVTLNDKGFKVLPDQIRVIWGDGCNIDTIKASIYKLLDEGWSIDNVAYGMGGGLLQKVNRDTQRFAFKCSSAIVNGKERDVRKIPATDPSKTSKHGRLALVRGGVITTIPEMKLDMGEGMYTNLLTRVYENGSLYEDYTFEEVREHAKK